MRIAVLFATRGGMGDVGKFVAMHAWEQNQDVRVAALSWRAKEGGGLGLDADYPDVTYPGGRAAMDAAFAGRSIEEIDVFDDAAAAKVEALVEGCDSIVACVGNRQPFMPRWIAKGTDLAVRAAQATKAKRLVVLNSFGIGEDWLPRTGFIPRLWAFLLATLLRRARADLQEQERIVRASGLDYLIVKPTGLTPEKPPTSTWKLAAGPGKHILDISAAKSDVALFMLQQAQANDAAAMRSTTVTIGGVVTEASS